MTEASSFLIGQENWAAQVPLKFTLARSEITTTLAPSPLYVLAKRLSYLPSLADTAIEYFRHVLPPGENTPWFDFNGLPLRWHVPLGVLHDLLAGDGDRPWELTIHFREFPTTSLLRWNGDGSLRATYLNSLKEAAYICTGTAAGVMGMASGAQDDLWHSVETANFGQYFRTNSSMNLAGSQRADRQPSIPLRLYIKSGKGHVNSYDSIQYTSRPVPACREDGSQNSLADALNIVLREYFAERPVDNSNIGETAAVSAGSPESSGASPQAPSAQARTSGREDEGQQWLMVGMAGRQRQLQVDGKQVDVLLCGIRPLLDTPLAWLHQHLHHPDHFLYAVLHVY